MARYTTTLNEYINSELTNMGQDEFINNGRLTIFDDEFQFIQKILTYDNDVHNIVTKKIFKGYTLTNNEVDKFFKKSFVMRFLDREIGRQTIESFASQVLYVTLTHHEYIHTVFGSEYQKYFEQHVDFNTDTIGNTIEQSTEHGETKQTQENNTKETHSDKANETHEDHIKETHEDTTNETHEDNTKETHTDTTNETHSDTSNTDTNSTDDTRTANATLPQSEVNINVDNTTLSYADENNISRNKNTSNTDVDSSGKSENKNTGNRNTDSNGESESHSSGNRNTDSNGESESISNGNRNSDYNGTVDGLTDSERNAQADNTSNTQSLTKSYLLDNLKTIYDMKDKLYNTYDKKCFLHIW